MSRESVLVSADWAEKNLDAPGVVFVKRGPYIKRFMGYVAASPHVTGITSTDEIARG